MAICVTHYATQAPGHEPSCSHAIYFYLPTWAHLQEGSERVPGPRVVAWLLQARLEVSQTAAFEGKGTKGLPPSCHHSSGQGQCPSCKEGRVEGGTVRAQPNLKWQAAPTALAPQ